MADTLSDAELVERLKAHKELGPGKAAAHFNMKASAFRGSIQLARARGLTLDTKISDPLEKARAELKLANAEIARIKKENDTAEKIRESIYGLAARDPEPPEWVNGFGGHGGSRGAPMVLWSDWHRGEIVKPEEVAGMNDFNSEVHDRRVKKLVDTIVDLSFHHMGRAKTKYPGIVVCLGGDLINGDIHQELVENSDRTTQQNINELTDLLAGALDNTAIRFGRVFVPCVVGNHGRGTLKPRMKARVYTSHEWNIYCNLARFFKNSKSVKFQIPSETDARFTVFGHRFLLTHGDSLGVKGGDGIIGAIGPIMRGAMKVGRSESQIDRDFDTLLMGHWHQYLTLPGVIVNNALKGYDEYARLVLRAPYSRPSQALWFVHPEHGITAHWQVYLEPQRTAKSLEWVSWQSASA